ncbi:tetratricopeptide repeat protein [Nitrospira sp. Nam74]
MHHSTSSGAAQRHPPASHNLSASNFLKAEVYRKTLSRIAPHSSVGAELGLAESQYMLGHLYLTGKEVGTNTDEALHWSRLAAKQGHPDRQISLGLMSRAW